MFYSVVIKMSGVRFRLGNACNLIGYDIIYQRISTFHEHMEQNMDKVSAKKYYFPS